jgi:hypothetical protein
MNSLDCMLPATSPAERDAISFLSLVPTAEEHALALIAKIFRKGDHVEWNSEAGRVHGVIQKKVVSDIAWKGYVHHATRDEPQYFIKSDRSK